MLNQQESSNKSTVPNDHLVQVLPIFSENRSTVKKKYRSELMFFDIQKGYTIKDDASKHLLIVSAEFTPQFMSSKAGDNFDNQERNYLLEQTLFSLMNMIEFKFQDYLFNRFEIKQSPSYFQK